MTHFIVDGIAIPRHRAIGRLRRPRIAIPDAPSGASGTPAASESAFGWSLGVTSDWTRLPRAQVKAQNAVADGMYARGNPEAYIMVIAEIAPGLSPTQLMDAALKNAKTSAQDVAVLDRAAFAFADGAKGERASWRGIINGLDITYLTVTRTTAANSFQIIGFAGSSDFDRTKGELMSLFASFTVPE